MLKFGRSHVDLRAQNPRSVGELPGPHALEQIQVLFDGAVAVRAVFARLGQRAAVFANLVCRKVVRRKPCRL